MKQFYKLLLFLLLVMPSFVDAAYNDNCTIKVNGHSYDKLLDNDFETYKEFDNANVSITCDESIKGLYIKYKEESSLGSITEERAKLGVNGFIHEYVELSNINNILNIEYPNKVGFSDIYVFKSTDEIPSWVERWEILDKADMALFSTHGDDEQLFFLGLLPKYASEGKKIQVIYFANHNEGPYKTYKRCHEQLSGLWTVGIKYYPELGYFPDLWATSFDEAVSKMEKYNYTYDDAVLYQTRMIRKYKPDVIVGHDLNGEYSHGQHILNVKSLQDGYLKAMDDTYDEESFKEYGVHEIQKFYIHLLKEKEIVMDYDTPLDYFDGKSAFQVSQEGFSKHISQQNTWFHEWIYGKNEDFTKATQIKTYSPLKYGLFYSSVGDDVLKNDMFENVVIKKEEPEVDKPSEILENIKKNIKKVNQDKNINIKNFNTVKYVLYGVVIVLSLAIVLSFIKKK